MADGSSDRVAGGGAFRFVEGVVGLVVGVGDKRQEFAGRSKAPPSNVVTELRKVALVTGDEFGFAASGGLGFGAGDLVFGPLLLLGTDELDVGGGGGVAGPARVLGAP